MIGFPSRRFGVLMLLLISSFVFTGGDDDNIVEIQILQLNDVYELMPLGQDGGQGGLARVKTLRNELQKANPNTFAVLGGDLISPSALSLAKVDGVALDGKQMISAMNHLIEYATLGNHEFDKGQRVMEQRIAESKFQWLSANVFHSDGKPFDNVLPKAIFEMGGIKIGIFGLTIDTAARDWIRYNSDYLAQAKDLVNQLKSDGAQFIIGLTHLDIGSDMHIAEAVDDVDIILGGHEHENIQVFRGDDFTPIHKADANARTVYIHTLRINQEDLTWTMHSRLQVVDSSIPDDPEMAELINGWVDKAFTAFRAQDIDPEAKVATPDIPLDGREASIRNSVTELTKVLANGMREASDQAQASLYNSGSIRIDDVLPAGLTLTEYDILRILPFGGVVRLIEIRGDVLIKTLDQGVANKGSGGWLQYAGITQNENQWQIGDQNIDSGKNYKIVVSDFLLTGGETGLDYFSPDNPNITVIQENVIDFRVALANGLKKRFP